MKSKCKKIANKYVKRFLRKQGFFDELNGEYYECSWGLDGVGGAIEVSDYFISFEDIRTDIDRDVEKGVYPNTECFTKYLRIICIFHNFTLFIINDVS